MAGDWGVDFKLAAPGGATVSGVYGDGRWIKSPKVDGAGVVIEAKLGTVVK